MIFTRLQNSTAHPISFYAVLSSDHVTPATGKTWTLKAAKDATGTGASVSGAVTELDATNLPGWYSWAGNSTDRNTVGDLVVTGTATGCDNVDFRVVIEPWDPFNATLPADVQTIKTQTVTAAAGVTFPTSIGTSTYAGADTSGTTTLLTRVSQAVLFDGSGYVKADTEHWAAAALPTSFTASNLPSTYPIDFTAALPGTPTAGTVGEALKFSDTRLDAAVSTRLATAGYTAPDNADIATALADLVTLLSRTDPTTALTALTTTAAAIKAKTDNLPASPAAVSDVTGSTTAVNAHTDTAVSTLATATNLTAVKTDTGNLILMTTGTGTNRAYTVPALANAPASGGSATIVTRQDINAPIVNNPR